MLLGVGLPLSLFLGCHVRLYKGSRIEIRKLLADVPFVLQSCLVQLSNLCASGPV